MTTKKQLQEALDLITESGTAHAASKICGIPHSTLQNRMYKAIKMGMVPQVASKLENEAKYLKERVKVLTAKIREMEGRQAIEDEVKNNILKMTSQEPDPPQWVIKSKRKSESAPGVPTLFCSDWHWGEVIDENQVEGIDNKYNLKIARDRAKKLIETTVDLLHNHMVNPNYPGIVLLLGGDLFSGDIHEELTETNEKPLMAAFLDLLEVMIWIIGELQRHFGRVFIVGVCGNHGRTTYKPRHKNRVYSNFDWLLYQVLRRQANSKDITFLVPDGTDAYYRIFNHRYLLTHGDQFRGGDGMIGPIGPIMRGDHKKRSRQSQVGRDYDTLLLGHFHQLMQMQRVIVNGSLCGYNEYAYNNNFPWEPPRQALWVTHPKHGITYSMPVHVEAKNDGGKHEWVSVAKE